MAATHHRTLPILLVLGLLLAWLPAGAAWADAREVSGELCEAPYDAGFDDIAGSAHEEMILCMADLALTEGVGDGSSYAPRRNVTRGQMASFVARFLVAYTGAVLPEGDPGRFDDVPRDDRDYPHSTSIHSLAEIEVVEGTSASDGRAYAPQRGVTRAQMASMIRRALAWADDGDARNDSAPPAAGQAAFDDTRGSVHEDNIDAIAAVGIVQGFGDGTYRPGDAVKRDQMASFVMRSYDYALAAELGGDDPDDPDDPEPGPVAILSPTSQQPAFPVSPGDELDITFRTDRAGEYELEFRDPDPDADGGFLLPGDGGEPGPWTDFDGEATSGTVAEGDVHQVTVTLPDDEDDESVRDVRLSFVPDDEPATTITHRQDAAIVVADGVVINQTQERVDFELQAGIDEADAGDTLLAVGEFEETVTIDTDGLLLSGLSPEDTVLTGSFVVDGVEGLTLSDMAISDYATLSELGLFGEDIGILLGTSTDVALRDLELQGSGSGNGQIGVRVTDGVAVDITDSTFTDNAEGVHVSGDSGENVLIGDGNVFESNARGVLVDGDARFTTITGSEFHGTVGIRVDVHGVEITDNVFEEHTASGLRLFPGATGAEVTGNEFADSNEEHLRFDPDDYPTDAQAGFLEDNDYESAPDVVDQGDWRIIRPPDDEAEGQNAGA